MHGFERQQESNPSSKNVTKYLTIHIYEYIHYTIIPTSRNKSTKTATFFGVILILL
jgi:hypothetical protein